MAKGHTHWPDGKGPVCGFATKRECDIAFMAWKKEAKAKHDHDMAEKVRLKREAQRKRFDDYLEKERIRMEAGLPWQDPSPSQKPKKSTSSRMTAPSPTRTEPAGPETPSPQPAASGKPSGRVIQIPRPSSRP